MRTWEISHAVEFDAETGKWSYIVEGLSSAARFTILSFSDKEHADLSFDAMRHGHPTIALTEAEVGLADAVEEPQRIELGAKDTRNFRLPLRLKLAVPCENRKRCYVGPRASVFGPQR